jgi:hypothetical protein
MNALTRARGHQPNRDYLDHRTASHRQPSTATL